MSIFGDATWCPGVTLEDMEKMVIKKAFQFYGGNKTLTAKSLGIAIRTLDKKLEEYAADHADVPFARAN